MGKECKSSGILHFQGSERFIDVFIGGKQRIRCIEINSMFRTAVQVLVSTRVMGLKTLKTWFDLSRVKLYRNDQI